MKPSELRVHIVDPSSLPDPLRDLTDADRHRASRFHFGKDAAHWIACRAALRRILASHCALKPADVPIVLSADGKPALAAPFDHIHFNLSHCADLALIAISRQPVGIDLEAAARGIDLLDCAAAFCHPVEIESLPPENPRRAETLLEIWTAKEAVLKALGSGLLQAPESIQIIDFSSAKSDAPVPGLESQSIQRLHHPELQSHIAFVSTALPSPEITWVVENARV